jgi:GPH family glycoside/pentoside/hexuronide:cation symporter
VAAAALLCYFGTFERRQFEKAPVRPPFNFKKYVMQSWKSKPFRQVALAYLCAFTVIGLLQTLLPYYATYWLRAPEMFVILAGAVLVLAIVSTPLWTYVSNKLGKRAAFMISCALCIASLAAVFFIGQLDLGDDFKDLGKSLAAFPAFGYIGVCFLGIGVGGVQLLPFSMMPDAINVSMKEGETDEGAYYGIVTFVQKIGMGAATLLIGPILQIAKYKNPPSDWNTELLFTQENAANQTIRAMFIGLSALVIILGMLAVWNYKVDRKVLQENLKEKEQTKE